MLQRPRLARWPILLAATVVACLIGGIFWPILGYDFVDMDLDDHVVENPHIRGLTAENLKHILTSRCYTSYYPVRSLTYAIDYQLWGLSPRGFKLTNGLLHLANALLVFWLVLRLAHDAPGAPSPRTWWDAFLAAFSAALFAVHPVVVEPVTWVPGREELLMTLGALGSMHLHLTARRFGERGNRRRAVACHAGVALCCAAACLSNAVAVVIPLIIVAWDMLTLSPPRFRKILYGTAALWPMSVATIVIKKLGYNANLLVEEAAFFSVERLVVVLNVYWLNLKTLVWPTPLAISYELTLDASFRIPGAILGGIAVGLTGLALWGLRRQKLVLFGLVWCGLALGPTSQIMPHHIHRADRFLYLPLVGLALAVAMAIRPLRDVLHGRVTPVLVVAAGVLTLLCIFSGGQVRTWQNSLAVWQHCVKWAPTNSFAHRSLADNYVRRKRFDLAIPHFETALHLNPTSLEALNNYALELATWTDERFRNYPLAIKLAHRACVLNKWQHPKLLRTLAMAYNNLAVTLEAAGEFNQAVDNYNKALLADPSYAGAYFNLALLRATCHDESFRRGKEAVQLAERACEMVRDPEPNALMILAAAYAEAGRVEMAVRTTQRAIEVAQADGDTELADQLRGPLNRYQSMMSPDSASP